MAWRRGPHKVSIGHFGGKTNDQSRPAGYESVCVRDSGIGRITLVQAMITLFFLSSPIARVSSLRFDLRSF
jgi:hypothetical protein